MIVNTIKRIEKDGYKIQASSGFSTEGYHVSKKDGVVHVNIQINLAAGVSERTFNNGDVILRGLPKPLGEFIVYGQPWCNWSTDYSNSIPIRMRVTTDGQLEAHYPSGNEKMIANSPVCVNAVYLTNE